MSEILTNFHIGFIFTLIFAAVVLLQLLFYLALMARFSFHKPKKIKDYHQDPVSIVIASKNDAHYLIKSLPIILTQQYNNYEVVVVSDNSDDETAQVVEDFQSQYPNLKFVNLTSSVTTIKGKKFPLSIGIRVACNEIILLTEPDCIPVSQYWLQNMTKHFVNKTQIVLGYGAYEKKKGIFNALVRYDTLHTAIQYFSYALAKMPFMGVGRNLAYTKSLFMEQKGFASYNHILYGEDDLFINRVANSQNCDIEYFSESFTLARPKYSFNYWLRQKRQHHITQKYYQPKHKILLYLYNTLMPFFYIFCALSLAFSYHNFALFVTICALFALKFAVLYLIFGFSAKKLNENNLIPFIFAFDILFSVINPLIYITSRLTKNRGIKWK